MFRLSSAIGIFTFEAGVLLSTAKMIRDTVTAQFLWERNGPVLKNEEDCYKYILDHDSNLVNQVPFKLALH